MAENSEPERIDIQGWPFRVKMPPQITADSPVLLLLHGHLGNENVMWILVKPLPDDFIILSPRAPIQTGPEQFSWHEISTHWPDIRAYQHLAEELLSRVDQWMKENQINVNFYDVMGFSQGAVLAYSLALLFPDRIGKVAALAGFIPRSWQQALNPENLSGKEFFIAHGVQDNIVPIKQAQQAAEWLGKRDAEVTFCQADIGHKLSADCYKGLGEFFS